MYISALRLLFFLKNLIGGAFYSRHVRGVYLPTVHLIFIDTDLSLTLFSQLFVKTSI